MNFDSEVFDICFLSMSDISTDARTINFSKTFAGNDKKVAILSYGTEKDFENLIKSNIHLFPVTKPASQRTYIKTYHFQKWIKKNYHIKSKIYWAEDIYSLYPASMLAKRYKGKLIYDSREIYSALGPLYKNPVKQKFLALFEKRLVKLVIGIIVTGEMDAAYLKDYFKTDIPFYVIRNLPFFKQEVQSNLLREKYSIPQDKLILIYQGELLPGRGIIKIIEALKYLPNAVFCILGDGAYKNEITESIKLLSFDERVFLCGKVPYDKLHEWSCSADIGIAFIEPVSFSYELALPNKLFEYCMAGVPSLVSDLPAMRAVLEKYPIGKLISPDSNPEEIANAIKEISPYEKRKEYKISCKEAAKIFCYESQEDEILSIIKD